MYNDLDKKFELTTKKALPFLVLAPPEFKKRISELMDGLFHQLLQRSEVDFDEYYAQINDMLDNRTRFESNLEVKVQNFANRFVSQEKTILLMSERLVKLEEVTAKSERQIKALKKSVKTLKTPKEEIGMDSIEDVHSSIPSPEILKTPDGFFCGRCKTTKLHRKSKRYYPSLGVTLELYFCPNCNLSFKMDENGNIIPTKHKEEHKEEHEEGGGFYCEFCENSKLVAAKKPYSAAGGAMLTTYRCQLCRLTFKFDDAGNSIPIARNKGSLEKAEQRRKTIRSPDSHPTPLSLPS